jgi:Xaa-Pro aminopeptidase
MEDAFLWTDSRYYIQAEKELDSNFWKMKKLEEKPWSESVEKGISIGFDPALLAKYSTDLRTQ